VLTLLPTGRPEAEPRPLSGEAELRPLEPRHAAEFAAHLARARDELVPRLPHRVAVADERGAREWLAGRAAARDGGVQGLWLDGVLVGGALFRTFDTRTGTCDLGVWLEAEASGHGLVTRTARHMINGALGRGMHRVEWHSVPADVRSIAVAKRLGMTFEGVLREAFPFGEDRYDVQVWSLLAREWVTDGAEADGDAGQH
jgi:ribosomal-protein-serine acetyltransferase